jgi:hypothetical protein
MVWLANLVVDREELKCGQRTLRSQLGSFKFSGSCGDVNLHFVSVHDDCPFYWLNQSMRITGSLSGVRVWGKKREHGGFEDSSACRLDKRTTNGTYPDICELRYLLNVHPHQPVIPDSMLSMLHVFGPGCYSKEVYTVEPPY